ncbi:MAG: hypothetical protein Q8L86_08880 [Vicinamibacterales bacterium]|nr:hypothetical protein [Vicinamibacterales bacterium]
MSRFFMTDMPPLARAYVASVIVAAAAVWGLSLPPALESPGLLVVLLIVAAVSAVLKVRLPIERTGLTMSVSFVAIFMGVLLLDPASAMAVAAASAWAQCSLFRKEEYPAYRTVFSIASVMLATAGAGVVFTGLGGTPALDPAPAMAVPVVAAGTTFFLLNSWLVGGAIALATGGRLQTLWSNGILWSAPGYVAGSLVSAGLALLVINDGALVALMLAVPAYVNFRIYQLVVARMALARERETYLKRAA